MSSLRLLIKQPGCVNTYLPVKVNRNDTVGNCISFLVDHLGLPKRDATGRMLTYVLRPCSGGQPLESTIQFAEAQLLPETRLVLEGEVAPLVTRPLSAAIARSSVTPVSRAASSMKPWCQMVNRRTFMVGGILAGCAISGLLAGMTTAFAARRNISSIAMSSSHPPGLLQPSLRFALHQQTVRAVSWSPDGTMLVSGADDEVLLVWTLDGQVHLRIPHPTGIAALAWSPSGQQLASGAGTSVRFFDAQTGTLLVPARSAHTRPVTSLTWTSVGEHPLVSGSLDQRAIVWNTLDDQPQATFTGHTAAINALICQPDGPLIASVSQGGAVRIWRVDTLAESHRFYDTQIPLYAVAFAPMGQSVAVGGQDGQVWLWSNGTLCQHSAITAQGTLCLDEPLRFRAHLAPVRSLSWSPDARYLATGSKDGTLAIWTHIQEGTPTLVTKTTSTSPVEAVAWSPVGGHIAVASGKTVTIWNIGI